MPLDAAFLKTPNCKISNESMCHPKDANIGLISVSTDIQSCNIISVSEVKIYYQHSSAPNQRLFLKNKTTKTNWTWKFSNVEK